MKDGVSNCQHDAAKLRERLRGVMHQMPLPFDDDAFDFERCLDVLRPHIELLLLEHARELLATITARVAGVFDKAGAQ